MDFAWLSPIVYLAWLLGAVAFVIGLIRMNSPATARNGNLLSAGGMTLAIVATAVLLFFRPEEAATAAGEPVAAFNSVGWLVIIAGIALGGGVGVYTARGVKMTATTQDTTSEMAMTTKRLKVNSPAALLLRPIGMKPATVTRVPVSMGKAVDV